MQKAMLYVGMVAGLMYILMAVYVSLFDTVLKNYLGTNKAYGLSVMLAAYGIFRLWRVFKMTKK